MNRKRGAIDETRKQKRFTSSMRRRLCLLSFVAGISILMNFVDAHWKEDVIERGWNGDGFESK